MRFTLTLRKRRLILVFCSLLPAMVLAQSPGNVPDPIPASEFPDDIHLDSLARLPAVQREDLDAAGREAFDLWVRPGTGYGSGLRGPVGMWMHSPELATAIFDVRQRVRYGTEKDQRLTELVILSTAREINHQYEWTAHEPLGETAGLEQEIMDFVKYRRPLSEAGSIYGFGETEQTVVRFVRELFQLGKPSSATFARALEIFGEEGLTDLVGLIGYYGFVAITLNAFDVQRPPDSELLLPMPAN